MKKSKTILTFFVLVGLLANNSTFACCGFGGYALKEYEWGKYLREASTAELKCDATKFSKKLIWAKKKERNKKLIDAIRKKYDEVCKELAEERGEYDFMKKLFDTESEKALEKSWSEKYLKSSDFWTRLGLAIGVPTLVGILVRK